jgi:hypothetical protein
MICNNETSKNSSRKDWFSPTERNVYKSVIFYNYIAFSCIYDTAAVSAGEAAMIAYEINKIAQ